jgi:hypothetical protein
MAFSVQFATEFTSRAAPRTVLHAATPSAAPISTTVVIFWNMDSSSYDWMTAYGDHIALSAVLATELTSRAAPRTVLQAAVASAAPIKTMVAIF